ncbi:SPE1 [Candida theae]|uniref:Ornithine decarboxylase n=1 Tax=Candida theae TaxID=1198502 RepID=A0AAD5BJ30_9ASCO|nr:SPE1 [Candida theae]KAI5966627.1 SPE1 [Candida theae]
MALRVAETVPLRCTEEFNSNLHEVDNDWKKVTETAPVLQDTHVGSDVDGHVPERGNSAAVGKALVEHVKQIDHEECDAGDEDSFFVCDLNEVVKSVETWHKHLPRIQPHYAIKCNTNLEVIKLLHQLGVNYDCASKNEIDTVLKLGISADKIIYANPCKTNSFIRHAKMSNVNLTTVDNAHELEKLAKFHPECKILVRIMTDDEGAQCRLSTKFGCSLTTAIESILPTAQRLGLSVVGVAFHVGSGAKDFDSIYKAIRDSREVFNSGLEMGFAMNLLDIGGGFETETFVESSKIVNVSIDEFFPQEFVNEHKIKFIAEPGRFMVANAFTLATHVIAKRELQHQEGGDEQDRIRAMLYINDGVYGNMNCILFDHQHPTARVLKSGSHFHYDYTGKKLNIGGYNSFNYSIWGPTCDGLDCVSTKSALHCEVEVGDWIYFPNLGAYTSAAATQFNGFENDTKIIYIPVE